MNNNMTVVHKMYIWHRISPQMGEQVGSVNVSHTLHNWYNVCYVRYMSQVT